jgi:hypothetical protein
MSTTYLLGGERDPEFLRRMSAPENEIPVAVPLNTLLARTADAAVALTGLQVYSSGVSFDLAFRVRSPLEPAHLGLSGLVFERGPSSGRFLLGIELADGRRASNVHGREPSPDVVTLWPWSPPDHDRTPPPAPDLPPGSWFSDPS